MSGNPRASLPPPETYAKRPEEADARPSRRLFGRRIKFIWGASGVVRGQWHLGLFGRYDRLEGRRWDGLAVSVRGLLLWGVVGAAALYFGGAAALHAVRNRNPYNLVRYSDLLLWPVQRARVAELTGRAFIAEGLVDLHEKRYAEGIRRLRIGLQRCPEDTRARRALGQFYLRSHQRARALQVLIERLDTGYPGRAFLTELFSIAAAGEDHAVILEACERYGAGHFPEPPAADRPWLLQQRVQALLAAGRADDVLRVAATEGTDAPAAIKEGRVLALLALGRSEEAIELLAGWRAHAGRDLAQVARLQARAFREARRMAEMDAALHTLRSLTPADPRPAVYGVVQRALADRDAAAATALGEYFFRFGGSADNLRLVAEPLAEIAALPLVQRCFDRAAALGHELKPFRLLLLRAQMQCGDWTAAQQVLHQLRPALAPDDPAQRFWLEWQERLIAAADDPSLLAQAAVLEILENRLLPLPVFWQTASILLRANRPMTARRAVDLGRRNYPASASLLKLLAEIERAAGGG